MNKLLQRIITGAAFLIVVISSVTISPWIFALLFGICTVIGINEFYKMSGSLGFTPQRVTGYIIGIVTFLVLFLLAMQEAEFIGKFDYRILYILPVLVIMIPIIELFRQKPTPTSDWAQTLFAVMYVALPFGLMSNMLYLPGTHQFSNRIILSFFVFVWISDTGAYCAGTLFGKHKLFERISPKKTIEGLAGGILLTVVASIPVYYIAGVFSLGQWIVISIVTVVFANLGDLVESMIKRNTGVKDSGRILPGHGGILDRFDSMLLAVPPVWLTISLMS